ncbi:MAG: cryptochrome/photolyase family protein [Desulfobacterales bacterium]|nr:cryptochrome/photolyase family protein [Desulfobacterales bacterium]
MTRTKTVRLILGDQLNEHHSWFAAADDSVLHVLMEVRQETDYVVHHIQKVAAFFSAMRSFAGTLSANGHQVKYLKLGDPENRQNFAENLFRIITETGAQRFEYLAPDEYRLDRELRKTAGILGVDCLVCDTEHFLTGRKDLGRFFAGKKTFRMESFYRHMRKKHDILMDGNSPFGGRWNFDVENRQAYDGKTPLPTPVLFENDVTGILQEIESAGITTIGGLADERLLWPVDRPQSLALLHDFIQQRLPHFGTYQDAMIADHWDMFHSRLSFSLNTKMLHPAEVIHAAVSAWKTHKARIGLEQVEGFVRQILGWREYMRGIYWHLMPALEKMNFFSHKAKLPGFYWTGKTKMACMAAAIGQSLKQAYAHHIQRLMVTGNFALLAGVHPDEVDAWYMGIYIDAIQWVELPNTRGMSQWADGGLIATKPYVSTARYIDRMSDSCSGCFYDKTSRTGGRGCPFNSLYWDFFARHRDKLAKNPRIGMMVRTWDRMKAVEQEKTLARAAGLKRDLDDL